MDKTDTTIDTLVKQFLASYNATSDTKDQLARMISTCKSFCGCFEDTGEQINQLDYMFSDPIKYVLKNHEKDYSPKKAFRVSIRKSLPLLEWIYYRDTRFRTSLRKEYHIDETCPKRTKFLLLADIIEVRGYIYIDLWSLFIKTAVENEVEIDPMLMPQINNSPIVEVKAE